MIAEVPVIENAEVPSARVDDLTPLPDEADAAAAEVVELVVTEPGAHAAAGVVDRCHAEHGRHGRRHFWGAPTATAAVGCLVFRQDPIAHVCGRSRENAQARCATLRSP